MSEPSNEIAAPAPSGETSQAEEIQWNDAPPEPVAAPAEPSAPSDPAPAIPEPEEFAPIQLQNGDWELRTETGGVYRGKSELEAYRSAAKGKVEADKTIRQLREAARTPPATPDPTPSTPESPDATSEALWDLLAPSAGVKSGKELLERLNHLQQSAEGFQQLNQQQRESAQMGQFIQANPDFTPTPANAEKLDEVLSEMSRAAGLPEGKFLPLTQATLKMAHMVVKGQGGYEVVQEAPRTPSGQFAPRTNVMPMPPRSAAAAPAASKPDLMSMTDEQFAEYEKQMA